ncbi:type I restriction-modification system subunit M [Natroniella sp. ANB-PHB2]|uniref:type I restriction-modification system subunit M n=1 Tax=Natroniella sp. ANB-PHB2 TaxID=3384444 RepID=UPI0038D4FCA9
MGDTKQETINNALWKACDTFRGKIDSSIYKDYVLVILFLKYLSDIHKENLEEYREKYDGDETRIQRALKRERFVLDEECTFDYLYSKRNESDIGETINKALMKLEEENKTKLRGVFRNIDFNSEAILGSTKDRNFMLKHLLEDFDSEELDLRPSKLGKEDIIGNAYMYLVERFASDAGKKGGEFFTPSMVSELLARLVKPQENDRIYDPTCGSGSLLIKVVDQVPSSEENKSHKVAVYGQERNGQTHSLCKLNMFLNSIDDARIEWGDTIANPKHLEDDKLMKFQVVVANPPFSLKKWYMGFADEKDSKKVKLDKSIDPYGRFELGVPPKSRGDYAFILHMIHSMAEDGRMAVVLPHGVLFRSRREKKIRQRIIEENLLDAVIGLPENLFFGTGIPACVLVMKKNRERDEILFVDASGEDCYEDGTNQNKLREEDIAKIVETYENYETIDKYSYLAPLEEIEENNYNLNIPRYVDTFEEPEPVDMDQVANNIAEIKEEIEEVEEQMQKYIKELGL